jgi:hypothetical protein
MLVGSDCNNNMLDHATEIKKGADSRYMPIKNYTTIMPANRSISEIQDALVQHGATGMLYKYKQGTRRIEALQFLWRIKNR